MLIFRNTNKEEIEVNDYYVVKRATFPNFTSTDSEDILDWDDDLDEDDTSKNKQN